MSHITSSVNSKIMSYMTSLVNYKIRSHITSSLTITVKFNNKNVIQENTVNIKFAMIIYNHLPFPSL